MKQNRFRVLALDLEGTIISDAFSRFLRPGLYEFLRWCDENFERVVLFTCVLEDHVRKIAQQLVAEFLADARHHLAVALEGETVVGMASAVHYVHPDKAPELWVNEIGVAPSYRKSGLGKRLMKTLFDYGSRLGCSEAWVLTERENVAARRLYESVGGQESSEPPVYYTFDLGS